MQNQMIGMEKPQEIILQNIDARSESPESLMASMLKQGNQDVQGLKDKISSLQEELSWDEENAEIRAQLESITADLNQAYMSLQDEVKAINEQFRSDDIETSQESEVTEEFDERVFMDEVESVLRADDFNTEVFLKLVKTAESSDEAREILKFNLEEAVGKKYADKLLKDKDFSEILIKTMDVLKMPITENGPIGMSERNIVKVLAVIEVLGKNTPDLLQAVNLSRYMEGFDCEMGRDVIDVITADLDPETGDFAQIQFTLGMDGERKSQQINRETGESEYLSEQAMIQRSFTLDRKIDISGEELVKKSVHHDLLRILDSLQGSGAAAKITKESLRVYDQAGLDEVTLNASLERGGYAWAVYGYGWDEDKMALEAFKEQQVEKFLAEFDIENAKKSLKEREPDLSDKEVEKRVKALSVGGISSAKTEAVKQFSGLDAKDRLELLAANIEKMIIDTKQEFIRTAEEAGLTEVDISNVVKEYDEMLKEPQTVTPQRLAKIGKDGPFLRIGENGSWMTEANFLEAVSKGEDKEVPQMRGRFHAGKIGMSQTQWHGKMELKSEGAQKGMNRLILEDRLNKAVKI